MTSLENTSDINRKVENFLPKVENVLPKLENASPKNVIVGGAKKSFITLYKSWIKKFKYHLFAFISMITFYIAHQQKSFMEMKKLFKKN